MKAPIGIQLYSLRDVIEGDFIGTLRKVKEAGYTAVEFAGYFGERTAAQLKQDLRELGLTPLSAHIGLVESVSELDELSTFYRDVGVSFVNCAYAPLDTDEQVAHARSRLIEAALRFGQDGIEHGYHNHRTEFDLRNGEYVEETLLRPSTRATLNAQFDYAWMRYCDIDPAVYTRQWGSRLTPPHFKDLNADYKTREPGLMDAEVGNGIIDFEAVLAALRDVGKLSNGVIVEQECFNKDMFDAIAISAENIHRWLETV